MEIQELTLDTRPKIAVQAFGAGIPTIAVHGWMDNSASFRPLAEHLHGIKLYAMDLPGHGKSESRSSDAQYHFFDWAFDILQTANALELERFNLVGHSLGAAICSLTAALFPERIERVVLLDGLGPMISTVEEFPELLKQNIAARLRPARKPSFYTSVDAAMEVRKEIALFPVENGLRDLVARSLEPVDGGFKSRYDPRLKFPSHRLTLQQVMAFLAKIEAPLCIVRPDEGIPIDADKLKACLDLLKDHNIQGVKGKHHAHMEYPEQVSAIIKRHLGAA